MVNAEKSPERQASSGTLGLNDLRCHAAPKSLKGAEYKRLIAAVVDFRDVHGTAGAAARQMRNARRSCRRKRIARTKPWRAVVVEETAMEFVGAALGDDRDLADRAELRGVARRNRCALPETTQRSSPTVRFAFRVTPSLIVVPSRLQWDWFVRLPENRIVEPVDA